MLTTVIGSVHGGLFACVCVCSRARPGKVLQTKEEWVCKWTGVRREATRIQGKHIVHINVTTCVQTVRDRAPPTFAHFPSTPIFLSRQGVYCANLGARIAWPTINSHTWLSRSVCPDQTLNHGQKVSSGLFIWHIDCHHFNELASKNCVDKTHTKGDDDIQKLKRRRHSCPCFPDPSHSIPSDPYSNPLPPSAMEVCVVDLVNSFFFWGRCVKFSLFDIYFHKC